ncbi:acyltransferase [Lacticaseibacillus rhamnosus]|uniref:acyltransferase family protein n=1 Tax=Lacticaseibacillus rhamnosus TaxID=47715 RepID=UPI001013C401|nr:acyltransferase family protein [Lacticaseibacillus rhamnosus]RXS55115.1 acyltransferase [Lacticaseibacillus rhamnosus]
MKVRSSHQRIEWIDVAKGLGIIAVVLGHFYPRNTTFYESLYWWHMPLFFMIGGFFVKPTTLPTLKAFLARRFWPLLKQYFGYGVGLILLNFIIEQRTPAFTVDYLRRLIYGGTELNGYLSVFWFVTVYAFSSLLFSLLRGYLPKVWHEAILMAGLFWLGFSYPNAENVLGFPIPGNLDLVLVALPYMFVGWWLFHYARHIVTQPWFMLVALGVFAGLFVAQSRGQIDFLLYMKSHHLTDPLLASFVPVIICGGLFAGAKTLTGTVLGDWLDRIGCSTLPIMYGHKAVGYVLEKLGDPNLLVLVAAGVTIPLFLAYAGRYVRERWQGGGLYAFN